MVRRQAVLLAAALGVILAGVGAIESDPTVNENQVGLHVCTAIPFLALCLRATRSSYLRLIDACITQLKAQGLSRTCHESKEEEAT